MSVTSRACRARGLWRTTRHTDKRATLHRTAADRRPTNQVSARGKLNAHVARVGLVGEEITRLYEETAAVEFKLYTPYIQHARRRSGETTRHRYLGKECLQCIFFKRQSVGDTNNHSS